MIINTRQVFAFVLRAALKTSFFFFFCGTRLERCVDGRATAKINPGPCCLTVPAYSVCIRDATSRIRKKNALTEHYNAAGYGNTFWVVKVGFLVLCPRIILTQE